MHINLIGRGSVTFNYRSPSISLQRQILNALVGKYPGVHFGIYERGGPYSMQQYWEILESGGI